MNKKKISFVLRTLLLMFVCTFISGSATVFADNTLNLVGSTYRFEEDDDYPIAQGSIIGATVGNGLGTLSISGDFEEIAPVNGYTAYDIKKGNLAFNYSFDKSILDVPDTSWRIYEDTDNEVDGFELENNIGFGTIIVQTSSDGNRWVIDNEFSNVLVNDTSVGNAFATTKDIQLLNGCYYKITLVYEQWRKTDSTDIWFVSLDNHEYRKFADVYTFYAINRKENASSATPDDVPRKELGEKINTGKDNGFSGNDPIDKDDPHYGWSLGTFVVNGYTREVTDTDNTPVFLKNLGDRVTLWFNLQQDIDKLNGNEKLSIAEDDGGYDRFFEVAKTNFKHGTLIIRFTDHEGKKTDPIIYTDYLAAHSRTAAYTKVELFEEGDYEVALDYEIKDARGLINYYPNYKIVFKFSIRNGNCMVFPFDNISGAELNDKSVTPNGFKLDMAKSRYLTIDVQKSVLKKNGNSYVEDVRFNRPAKDGEIYDEEGIYTFTVNNLFTGENITKTIYVGESPVYLALAQNKISVEEINRRLADGEEFDDNGLFISSALETSFGEQENGAVSNRTVSSERQSDNANDNEEGGSALWIIIVAIVVAGAGIFLFRYFRTQNTKKGSNENISDSENKTL